VNYQFGQKSIKEARSYGKNTQFGGRVALSVQRNERLTSPPIYRMAIFSRRTIQRLINENASFLTTKQIKSHVDNLNNGDLGAEWEVVLLNVFSKLGRVEHEKNFNGKKPDIYFTSEDRSLD
jgi:hypothetical protein